MGGVNPTKTDGYCVRNIVINLDSFTIICYLSLRTKKLLNMQ